MIVAETYYQTMTKVALRWGISERTLSRYLARAQEDAQVSALVTQYRVAIERGWIQELHNLMNLSIRKLADLVGQCQDPKDIQTVLQVVVSGDAILSNSQIFRGDKAGQSDTIPTPKPLPQIGSGQD